MAISQFFVLSARGDTIVSKDYRGDSIATAREEFFRKVKFFNKGDCPPVFQLDGVTYLFVRKNGLLFVCTTRFNVSPSTVIEMLNRMTKVFKDYCGVLTEEAIRKNFTLIYELIDETMDYGYPQTCSTEKLKQFVYNEPILVASGGMARAVASVASRTTAASSVHRPIGYEGSNKVMGGKQKNEIFVDILERLNVLFSPSGFVVNSTIDGCIQMKSFLGGNPELKLALNEDLVIGKGGGFGSVVLDDCNFHECVKLDDFETTRTLSFIPPDGEFTVLNYRLTGDFRTPFRIFPSIDESSPFKLEVAVIIRADIPDSNFGANVTVRLPVPRNTASASPEATSVAGGPTAEYVASEKAIVWQIKKFPGGTEHTLRARITLASPATANTRKEVGPVALTFEIPMYNVSNLQVRYLRIAEQHKSYNPYRWVRYVTQSSSYVCRM